MPVLDQSDLEASPLADLHAIAGELGLDGYRRLRKADLIERILERTGDKPASEQDVKPASEQDAKPASEQDAKPASGRRTPAPRQRSKQATQEPPEQDEDEQEAPPAGRRRRAARRRRTGEDGPRDDLGEPAESALADQASKREAKAEPEERERLRGGRRSESVVEGVVELLANGSAFLHPDPDSGIDEDVYISAAQVRRCELDAGDRASGPLRLPRGSERHPSLVRIDTINGEPADVVLDRPRYDSLPAAFPSERFELEGDHPTLKAIEKLTPFGRGSRVVIVGAARSGKTETLRGLIEVLAGSEDLRLSLALAGVRPEELADWRRGSVQPTVALTFEAGSETQGQALDRAVEAAKRLAGRGENALLAIDTLDGVPPQAARRALAAARNIVDGGSLTVIATASEPFGGETTVIALDLLRASTGRLPALDPLASGTLKAELLVGSEAAAEIVKARAEAAQSPDREVRREAAEGSLEEA